MRKFLLLLPALALIGAGCAGSTRVETTAEGSTQADSSGLVVEQVPVEQDADSPTATANAEGELVIKTDGAEVVVQTETETEAEVEEDDGVPVTDVVLGAKADVEISMEGGNFFFAPKTINAKPGEKVKITFTKNIGFHTFVIDEIGLKYAIKQGEAVSFTAPKTAGSYAFYCDVGSHRANGMEGVLVVK